MTENAEIFRLQSMDTLHGASHTVKIPDLYSKKLKPDWVGNTPAFLSDYRPEFEAFTSIHGACACDPAGGKC